MKTLNNPIEYFKKLIDHEGNVREQLAINLHQSIFPMLLSLKVNLSLKNKHIADISQVEVGLEKEMKEINEIVEALRTFYYRLYPALLKHLGLFKAIHSNIREIAKKYSTAIDVDCDYFGEEPHLNKDWSLQVYLLAESIIEYLITNNRSTSFLVELKRKENELTIKISGNPAKEHIKEYKEFPALGPEYFDAIKARLEYLNATQSIETNWKNFVAVNFPFNF